MNNEALEQLIQSAKSRIYELNWEMRCLKKDANELNECLDLAVRDWRYEDASNAAHELANVYMKIQARKDEIAYLEKQIAKHQ